MLAIDNPHDTEPSGNKQSVGTQALGTGNYQFNVFVKNNVTGDGGHTTDLQSPTTPWYQFTDLPSAPVRWAWLQSYDYPPSQWGQPQGAPGLFTLGTNGASNIVGFAYSFDTAANVTVPTTTDCSYLNNGGLGTSLDANGNPKWSGELALTSASQAQIQVPASLTPGQHTLYVTMFDGAHNASQEASYTFYVAPNYQSVTQKITTINAGPLVASATGANANLLSTSGTSLVYNGTLINDTFTVSISVPATGTWDLGADMMTGNSMAEQQIELDQSTTDLQLGGTFQVPWDAYAPENSSQRYLDLGTPYLTKGTHTITFTEIGVDPNSNPAGGAAYQNGINYFTLSPTGRYEAEDFAPDSGTCAAQSGHSPGFAYDPPTQGTLAVQQWGTSVNWSDHGQLFLSNSAAGAKFTIQLVAPIESDYAIGANLAIASDYGKLQFDITDPGKPVINLDNTAASPFDAYNSSVSAQYVFLGGVHLTAGVHCLTVTVTGTDAASTGNRYNAGIDFLQLVPVTGATDDSFTDAMNNEGYASDGQLSYGNIDSSNSTTGPNLSLQAMAAQGITAGTTTAAGNTFNLNGATFTMPQLSSANGNIYDNVIPDGQTIKVPPVNATDVALLVASTCGSSPAMTATLGYGDSSTSNASIQAVPAWLQGPSNTAVTTLGYYDQGSSQDTNSQPNLYEVILPAKASVAITSITLPVMPVSFLPNTGSCTAANNALHVLAIGFRSVPAGPGGTVWTGGYAGPMDDTGLAPGGTLQGETVRESVSLSAPGSGNLRIHLTNTGANGPVTFDAATIAAQASAGGPVTAAAPVALSFGSANSASVTIPAGGDVYSNPVAAPSTTGGSGALTVSLHVSSMVTFGTVPVHVNQNAVTYYATGNQTPNSNGTPFTTANSFAGLAYLSGIDISDTAATHGTIAVFGDQFSTASPPGAAATWASDLPSALSSNGIVPPGSVVNVSNSGTAPNHWWQLNGPGLDTSTTAYDSGTGPNANLTLKNSAAWTTADPGTGTSQGALSLNGSTSYATTSGSVVNTAGSFTVSAWVNTNSNPLGNQTVVAQSGSQASGFYLGYNAARNAFGFYFAGSDSASPTISGAFAFPNDVGFGVWQQLTGTYNASTNTASFYLNGGFEGSATVSSTWSAGGNLTVGADLSAGAVSDQFGGKISDVRIFNSALSLTQVSGLYHDTGLTTMTTANAPAAFHNYVAAEPNLRDVIISLGADDVLEGVQATAIENNLRNLISAVNGQNVANLPATGVRTYLTTIPPLGLASTDPREIVRESVNSWILGATSCPAAGTQGNGGAVLNIDVACAVQQSTTVVNKINPSDLTAGVPNAAYYTAIANAVASTLESAFPPQPLVRRI